MKVYNLTDVETPSLKQRGLVRHTFAVADALIGPGESAEVDDKKAALVQKGLQELVSFGAIAVGAQPPAAYLQKKAQLPPAEPKPALVAMDLKPVEDAPASKKPKS